MTNKDVAEILMKTITEKAKVLTFKRFSAHFRMLATTITLSR